MGIISVILLGEAFQLEEATPPFLKSCPAPWGLSGINFGAQTGKTVGGNSKKVLLHKHHPIR